jgi:hypothetical protein
MEGVPPTGNEGPTAPADAEGLDRLITIRGRKSGQPRIVRLPRLLVEGDADLSTAYALSRQIQLTPLGR